MDTHSRIHTAIRRAIHCVAPARPSISAPWPRCKTISSLTIFLNKNGINKIVYLVFFFFKCLRRSPLKLVFEVGWPIPALFARVGGGFFLAFELVRMKL